MRIALLGNHVLPLQGLARLLEDLAGAEVAVTVDPSDQDGLFRRMRPDVVLLDAATVHEVESQVRVWGLTRRNIPFVIVAPHEADVFLVALRAGARGFTTRDATVQQLTGCIQAVMDGQWGLPRSMLGTLVEAYLAHASETTPESRPNLLEREGTVLRMLAHGARTQTIASELHVSEGTVRNDIRALIRTFGVENRTQLIAEAWRRGFLTADGAALPRPQPRGS